MSDHYFDQDRAMARCEAAYLSPPEYTDHCTRCGAVVDLDHEGDDAGRCDDCADAVASEATL